MGATLLRFLGCLKKATKKNGINLSLKYYLADSNGIISARKGTHDGLSNF